MDMGIESYLVEASVIGVVAQRLIRKITPGGYQGRTGIYEVMPGSCPQKGMRTLAENGVLKVNQQQNRLVVRKLQKIYGSVQNLTVGILGLTYKAGTSTLRRSAALEIIKDLTSKGASVKAYDPKASVEEIRLHKEFEFFSEPYDVARGSDALVIVTDWPEFKNLDFDLIKSSMNKPVIIDAKNMLDDDQLIKKGFLYTGVGRGKL